MMTGQPDPPLDETRAKHRRQPDRGEPAEARPPAPWLGLLAAPVAIGTTSPSLILTDIGGDLGVSTRAATWLVITFGYAIAVGTPLIAGLVRQRGVRAGLSVSAALVLGGTLLVLVVPWLPVVLAGRAAQGAGGAGLVTIAMALAGSPRRMGVITAGISMCGAIGPLAGAQLGHALSWRVALALSAVSLIAVPVVVRSASGRGAQGREPFDARGAAALVALVTALVFVPMFPAPAAVCAIVAAVLCAAHIRRRPDGFLPVEVLRTPVFLFASGLAFVLATSYFTLLYAVPELLGRAAWSAHHIGLAQLVALLTGSVLAAVLAATAPALGRTAVVVLLVGLGALAATIAVATPWVALLPAASGFAVLSASSGQAILAVVATGPVSDARRATAIGLFNLCYQLGGAFGPAISALLLT